MKASASAGVIDIGYGAELRQPLDHALGFQRAVDLAAFATCPPAPHRREQREQRSNSPCGIRLAEGGTLGSAASAGVYASGLTCRATGPITRPPATWRIEADRHGIRQIGAALKAVDTASRLPYIDF